MRLEEKVFAYLGQLRHDPGPAELEEIIRMLVFHIQRLEECWVNGPWNCEASQELCLEVRESEQHFNDPGSNQTQQETSP